MMRGNCGRRLSGGNSGLILRAERSGWWIETELQIRFRLDFRFGFGVLTADDGLAEFLGWGGKWDMGREVSEIHIIFVSF
jgi:hypothetical protein